jgi:putative serine protease PepD
MSEQDRSGGDRPAEDQPAPSWWAGGDGAAASAAASAGASAPASGPGSAPEPADGFATGATAASAAAPQHGAWEQTRTADDQATQVPSPWQTPGDTLGGLPDDARAAWRPGHVPAGLLATGAVIVALVAALLGGAAGAWWADRGASSGIDRSASLPVPSPGTTRRPSGSVAGVAQRVLPSVVSIKVQGADGAGTGSGFVVREDGYVVTNNHVVEGAGDSGSIVVVFPDGSQARARVVGADASYDLAAIKVERKGLPALAFGDSSSVLVGDEVIAIGAPLGLDGTVTTGIVSALNRPVSAGGGDAPAFINAIQTDAAINPGNSGGPLVNLAGEVIAVNSAIARVPGSTSLGQSGNIGLGFAIPSQQARRTVQQLIRTGKAEHPVIGVLLDRSYTGQGVRVATAGTNGQRPVTPNGPADKAGIRAGDIITRFDGRPVSEPDQLVVAIRAKAPGDTVELTVRTGTRVRTVRMTLEAAVD